MKNLGRLRRILMLTTGLVGLAGGLLGAADAVVQAQSADSMYVLPASEAYKVGDTVSVTVRTNTTSKINAVGVRLSYGSNLQFVSIGDASETAFSINASSTGGNGMVAVDRGTTTPVSGDQLVAKITFKAVSAGSGSLELKGGADGSQALSSTTNQDVLQSRVAGAYTVAGPTPSPGAGSAPATQGSSGQSSSSGAGGQSQSASSSNSTQKTSSARVTITSQGSTSAAPLPGDSVVELNAPATIETTTDEGREVSKVEYLLNDKLVSTDTTAPYSHTLNTTDLVNGTYALTTKTYYKDGKIETSTASLVVSNPFGFKQFWLQLKHYAWLVALLLAVAGGLFYLKVFRGHGGGHGGHMNMDEGYGHYVKPGVGGVAPPSSPSQPAVIVTPTGAPARTDASGFGSSGIFGGPPPAAS